MFGRNPDSAILYYRQCVAAKKYRVSCNCACSLRRTHLGREDFQKMQKD